MIHLSHFQFHSYLSVLVHARYLKFSISHVSSAATKEMATVPLIFTYVHQTTYTGTTVRLPLPLRLTDVLQLGLIIIYKELTSSLCNISV